MLAPHLRDARINDAAEVAAIHCASWRSAYAGILEQSFLDGPIEADRAALWYDRLANPQTSQMVILAEEAPAQPVGFICAFGGVDQDWGSLIDNIHVLPTCCGQGYGARMMQDVATRLASYHPGMGIHLWVFEANEAGLRFYKRLGGEVVERDISRIPAAGGAEVLRIFWPAPSLLLAM
jgi:ribosomal protein S18 acetylase RimI-like enzyme